MPHKVLDTIPNLMSEYRRAIAGAASKRVATGTPRTSLAVQNIKVTPSHVTQYCAATGLRAAEHLPLTYPYVLTFPLVMKLMNTEDFPFRAIGTIHLSNEIQQERPLRIDENLDIEVRAEGLRRHKKGLLIDVTSDINGVWRQKSTFLGVGATLDPSLEELPIDNGHILPAAPYDPDGPAANSLLRVSPADIKAYADASGDKNPIHVSSIGAKAFGFPRTIAHGMWSAAAMLRPLEGELKGGGSLRYLVEFAKPVTLPGSLGMWVSEASSSDNADTGAQPGGQAWQILLRNAKKPDKLHAQALVVRS